MRTIGTDVLTGQAYGIAANGDILAVGTRSGKVFMFDMRSGDLLRSFGKKGSAKGQIKDIVGLRFTPDGGHILITEASNDRLSLFTLAGVFSRCIGDGILDSPYDVELAPNGDILVADWDHNRICVFRSDGSSLLRSIGSEGEEPGQFSWPIALALHRGYLYVLDNNSSRVQMFS